MIIDLASAQTTPKPLSADVDGGQIDLGDEGTVEGSAHFEGEFFREGAQTHLRGMVTAKVGLLCTRCAEPLTRQLEIPFEDVFVNASYEPSEKDLEVPITDLDIQLVADEHIDLIDVIREQILLNMPEQVLCKEDCKGLCPECGTNRNLKDCNCGEKDIDPRWAALKNLS
ncbi:MAG: YceD family protein [Pyrinomonadaceae bacterium]